MQEPRGASYAAGDMESRAKPQPLCWATIGATMGTVCFSRAHSAHIPALNA